MERDELVERMLTIFGAGVPFLLFAPVTGRDMPTPIGLVVVFSRFHLLEPHFTWFPWATARNKMESVAAFVHKIRKDHDIDGRPFKLFLASDRVSVGFWNHLMEYGLVGRCGWFSRFFVGSDAMIYYSKDLP